MGPYKVMGPVSAGNGILNGSVRPFYLPCPHNMFCSPGGRDGRLGVVGMVGVSSVVQYTMELEEIPVDFRSVVETGVLLEADSFEQIKISQFSNLLKCQVKLTHPVFLPHHIVLRGGKNPLTEDSTPIF